jgi:hypothetical protein
METRAGYMGFVLDACPQQLADDERWTTQVIIERHTGATVEVRPFSASNTWEMREEAVHHSWGLGRQIIDGRIPGCSPP